MHLPRKKHYLNIVATVSVASVDLYRHYEEYEVYFMMVGW